MGVGLAAAAGFCVPLMTPGPAAPTVVDAYVEAFNRHDLPGIRKLVTSNVGHTMVLNGVDLTRKLELTFKLFPDYKLERLERLAVDDLVAQTEKITDSNGPNSTGLAVYRVDGGCISNVSISLQ